MFRFISMTLLVLATGCAVSQKQEQELGRQLWTLEFGFRGQSRDIRAVSILERVSSRVITIANCSDQIKGSILVEAYGSDAVCLSGGKVTVYANMLPIIQDEASLAVVVSHLLAHLNLGHYRQRLGESLTINLPINIVRNFTGGMVLSRPGIAMEVFGVHSQLNIPLPFSSEQEAEADKLGLQYLACAGYEPRAATAFWARSSNKCNFFLLHPNNKGRLEHLRELLPEALILYNNAPRQYGNGESLQQEQTP